MQNQMYQVSTLQALMLGYTKKVVTAGELAKCGSIGLGTFENVNGEMIVLDHKVYKANNKGNIKEVDDAEGVPFAAVGSVENSIEFDLGFVTSIEQVKSLLDEAIELDFGLNSMYVVRLDGLFNMVKARSEEGMKSQHVVLKKILENNQQDFEFENIEGTMVCLYFPDYMDGINAPGWHLHFISKDRRHGGHVFDLSFDQVSAKRAKIQNIQIQLPQDAAFDTYALKEVSNDDVKKVEQSKE